MSAVIQAHSQGLLKDGRKFMVIDFQNLMVAEDGSILEALVGVVIDGKYISTEASSLAKHIDYEDYNRDPNRQ